MGDVAWTLRVRARPGRHADSQSPRYTYTNPGTALKSRSGTQSKFTKSGTSLAGTRKRLASELEDARVTLNFVTSAAIYMDETRPAVIQKVQAIINRLQEQLAQPGTQ